MGGISFGRLSVSDRRTNTGFSSRPIPRGRRGRTRGSVCSIRDGRLNGSAAGFVAFHGARRGPSRRRDRRGRNGRDDDGRTRDHQALSLPETRESASELYPHDYSELCLGAVSNSTWRERPQSDDFDGMLIRRTCHRPSPRNHPHRSRRCRDRRRCGCELDPLSLRWFLLASGVVDKI